MMGEKNVVLSSIGADLRMKIKSSSERLRYSQSTPCSGLTKESHTGYERVEFDCSSESTFSSIQVKNSHLNLEGCLF